MKTLHIYHHLGLGDHIICNGLVRHYATLYDKIYVFCKPHNIGNVSYMYRDNAKIELLQANDDEARSFMNKNKENDYLIVGHTANSKGAFDIRFYNMAYIPFEYKWDKFYLKRDVEKEKDVFYNKFKLKDTDEFIFVHDDAERGFGVTKYLPKNIKIIRPNLSMKNEISLFHYLYIIEKAKEVHCIDSSFLNLIDCIQLRNNRLFFHKYVRFLESGESGTPVLKMDWEVMGGDGMNSFLITSHGRTGTLFLSQIMNRSQRWQVLHQPYERYAIDNDKAIPERKFYNALIPEYQQQRFNQDFYGEVNGLLKYNFLKLKVGKKGIIYRDYKEVILSFSNGRDGRETIPGLLQKIKIVNLCHNMFYDILYAYPKILLINYKEMVSSVSYMRKLLDHFEIFDIVIGEELLRKKVNPNTKWNYKVYKDFPYVIQKLIGSMNWKDYSLLNNYLK